MYRKKINGIRLFCSLAMLGIIGSMNAQIKPTSSTVIPGTYSEVSLKQNKIPESQVVRGEDIVWKRDVYRIVDLQKNQNGALYYPTEPNGDQKNLFYTLFELIANNQVTAYKYVDGTEIFTDEYVLKFKDLLKNYDIPFKEKKDPKNTKNSIFDVQSIDIPCSEVTQYYVKEIYFLDQRTSSMNVKTVAICPILSRDDAETGEVRTFPMFWVPFESIRTYLSQMPLSADTLNSANQISAYDFFNQRRYQGDIYKVSNLRNQNIKQYCKTPEAIKAEQERLEKELQNIGNTLWEPSQRALREAEELQKAEELKKAREIKKPKLGKIKKE